MNSENLRLIQYSRGYSVDLSRTYFKHGNGSLGNRIKRFFKNLVDSDTEEVRDFRWAQLEGLRLNEAHVDDINLAFANISKCTLYGCWFHRTNFEKSVINSSHFFGGYGNFCNFQGARLKDVLCSARLAGSSFKSADLSDVDFSDSDTLNENLVDVDFSGSRLFKVNFTKVNLVNATFKDAYLSDVDFTGANIEHTDFRGAKFNNVRGVSESVTREEGFIPKYRWG